MPVTSTTSSRIPRTPSFLERVRGKVDRATFSGATDTGVQPFFERQGAAARQAGVPVMETPSSVESLAPPLPPPIPQPGPEFAERLARAVADLRRTGERLAEQTTADALEMAVLIARRIIEGELKTNPAALTGLIRSAVARLGESRKSSCACTRATPPTSRRRATAGRWPAWRSRAWRSAPTRRCRRVTASSTASRARSTGAWRRGWKRCGAS